MGKVTIPRMTKAYIRLSSTVSHHGLIKTLNGYEATINEASPKALSPLGVALDLLAEFSSHGRHSAAPAARPQTLVTNSSLKK